MGARTQIRPQVAAFTTVCGAATAGGSVLAWVSPHGARPALGMNQTSLSRMLTYSFVDVKLFWESAGFAVFVLGLLIVIGALGGVRTLTVLAALLALAAAGMWLGLAVHHFETPDLPNSYYLNPAHLPWADLREGAWLTIIGAACGLVSAFWLRRR